jgi:hypothetical protein
MRKLKIRRKIKNKSRELAAWLKGWSCLASPRLCVQTPVTTKTVTFIAWYQSLMPLILATWEAEIGRTAVPGQLGKIVERSPFPKITREKLEMWLKQ